MAAISQSLGQYTFYEEMKRDLALVKDATIPGFNYQEMLRTEDAAADAAKQGVYFEIGGLVIVGMICAWFLFTAL